jgi:CheY-like chemotaxis protein
MSKRILVVGNCAGDHAAIRRALRKGRDVEVVQGLSANDALELLAEEPFALVLVNRRLHGDGSDGIPLIRRIKADPRFAAIPVMLLSDYPEHQKTAVEAGALPGFGKSALDAPETQQKLNQVLS